MYVWNDHYVICIMFALHTVVQHDEFASTHVVTSMLHAVHSPNKSQVVVIS